MKQDRELNEALRKDVADVVIPFPTNTAGLLYRRVMAKFLPWTDTSRYLKSDPLFLHQAYRGEAQRLLPFPFVESTSRLPQVVVLQNTSATPLHQFIVRKLPPPCHSLPTEIRAMTEGPLRDFERFLKFTLRNYDGSNLLLRLKEIHSRGNATELVVEGVTYADYARTNLCLDLELAKGTGTLRQRVHPDGTLDKLSESPLGNVLGVAALLLTADGQMVIQKRSRWVAEVPGLLGPSYSGSANFDDVAQTLTLADFPVVREGREELGFKPEAVRPDSLQFLGLTRELRRGGKPEMFFAGQLALSRDDVQRNWNAASHKRESAALVFFPFGKCATGPLHSPKQRADFVQRVEALLDEHGGSMSLALQANLALWAQDRLHAA